MQIAKHTKHTKHIKHTQLENESQQQTIRNLLLTGFKAEIKKISIEFERLNEIYLYNNDNYGQTKHISNESHLTKVLRRQDCEDVQGETKWALPAGKYDHRVG